MKTHAKTNLKSCAALLAGLAMLLPYASQAAAGAGKADAEVSESAGASLKGLKAKGIGREKPAAPADKEVSGAAAGEKELKAGKETQKEAPEASGKEPSVEKAAPESSVKEMVKESGGEKELDKEAGDEKDVGTLDEKELNKDAGDEKEIEGIENEKETETESEADDKGELIEAEDSAAAEKPEARD
jgi:hypothetical protein